RLWRLGQQPVVHSRRPERPTRVAALRRPGRRLAPRGVPPTVLHAPSGRSRRAAHPPPRTRRQLSTPHPTLSQGERASFVSLSLWERGSLVSLSLWERAGVRGATGIVMPLCRP